MKLNPDTMQFIDELYYNNNREWFAANKSRYEAVRKDFVDFTQALVEAIRPLDPSIGSVEGKDCVYRIYRDLRFTKDKRPYKSHIACFLATGGDRTSCNPGYYFQVGRFDDDDEQCVCSLGGGIWNPSPKALESIRQEIYYSIDEFKEILSNPTYLKYYGTEFHHSRRLTRVPKGYPADWPDADLLKYKDYVPEHTVSNKLILSDELLTHVVEAFTALVPLNKFFQKAMWETL